MRLRQIALMVMLSDTCGCAQWSYKGSSQQPR